MKLELIGLLLLLFLFPPPFSIRAFLLPIQTPKANSSSRDKTTCDRHLDKRTFDLSALRTVPPRSIPLPRQLSRFDIFGRGKSSLVRHLSSSAEKSTACGRKEGEELFFTVQIFYGHESVSSPSLHLLNLLQLFLRKLFPRFSLFSHVPVILSRERKYVKRTQRGRENTKK